MLKGFVRVTTASAQCDYNDYNRFAASNSDFPKSQDSEILTVIPISSFCLDR